MEVELKLALSTADPQGLASRLSALPLLVRRKAVHQHLHNAYFDTPDQTLNRLRVALRLRRVGGPAGFRWLQTLKMGGTGESALSQRGEWETDVPGPQLDVEALNATPWSTLDPQGLLYRALVPCFTTEFDRTLWTLHNGDGSAVELALDIGHILVDGKTAPLCELELELLAGEPSALFRAAQQLSRSVATLPLGASKAQRGYALARNALHAPQQACPPLLQPDLPLNGAALRVLREAFSHFTTNLHCLLHTDDPELVHQARIGWRRFKTSLKLFRQLVGSGPLAELQNLQPLLNSLGALRDLEVARLHTLPMLANAYTNAKPARQAHWRAMEQAFVCAADAQRDAVHQYLSAPHVGVALLATTWWLELEVADLSGAAPMETDRSLQEWARNAIKHGHDRLKKSLAAAGQSPASAHRARILAKRLRYGIEALHPLLPKRRAKHWHTQASRLQQDMGSTRDVQEALALATQLKVHHSLLDFLRGYVSAKTQLANELIS